MNVLAKTRMQFGLSCALVIASGLVTSACGPWWPLWEDPNDPANRRDLSPKTSTSDLTALVTGNTALALDLYQALSDDPGNLFYSPYSISLALAMTYAGARGQTEAQMADALHFTLSQDRLHPAFNALDLELASRGEGAAGKDGEGFRLNIANAIWGQDGYPFLQEFLDTLAVNYGAGMHLLDFAAAPEPSRVTINDWVADQTEGRIKNLIPQGLITTLTRLVLTNAVYFNAAWAYPFDEDDTSDGPFHTLDASEVTVPMMHLGEELRYAEGAGYQAVELPYDGDELSMVILLPGAGEFKAFEASLDVATLTSVLTGLSRRRVVLTMPKFTYVSQFKLSQVLSDLGMQDAFIPDQADLSGMDGTRSLFISEVVHKAFVDVDEAGTEAAAATAVIVGVTSVPIDPPVEVTVDRPFIFLIRDIQTGTILFLGRVTDPTA